MTEHYPGHEQVPTEIERKFLVRMLPQNLEAYEHAAIHQGYLAIGADGSEDRLRARGDTYTFTSKSKGDIVRGECETELTAGQFADLWPATAGKRLEKVRYKIPYGDHTIELDIYEGSLRGLVIAEVEFNDLANAFAFEIPQWFGSEVSQDANYKNQSLAVQGRPYDFTG